MGHRTKRLPPLATNLRRARKDAGHSQYSLAEASGISRPTIANIEIGNNTNPGERTLKKLAMACGVEVTALSGSVLADKMSARLEAFLRTDTALAANATEEEKAWLRSLGSLAWGGGEPSDETYMYMLLAFRKRQPQRSS